MAGAPTDAELVARCRTGDAAAWALLVERFGGYVNAILARAYRLPPHVAEDVFQDTFARVYEHLPKLRDDAAFRPWLAQLTRRLAVDALRAGARERAEDGELIEYHDIAADDAIAELVSGAWTRAARELPRARREIERLATLAASDVQLRAAVLADTAGALQGAGLQPTSRIVAALRARLGA